MDGGEIEDKGSSSEVVLCLSKVAYDQNFGSNERKETYHQSFEPTACTWNSSLVRVQAKEGFRWAGFVKEEADLTETYRYNLLNLSEEAALW